MMKKIFSMMLLAASLFTIACDKDDDDDNNNGNDTESYVGTMSVDMTYYGMTLSTEQSGVTYLFEEDDDMASVTLSGVKFTVGLADAINALNIPNFSMEEDPYMPALDIVLPNIPETGDDTYELETITPTTLYGDAFDTDVIKAITNVKVVEGDDKITVSFDCSMALSFGDVEATITFEGNEVE